MTRNEEIQNHILLSIQMPKNSLPESLWHAKTALVTPTPSSLESAFGLKMGVLVLPLHTSTNYVPEHWEETK